MRKVFNCAIALTVSVVLTACGSNLAPKQTPELQSRVETRRDGTEVKYYAPGELPDIIQFQLADKCMDWVQQMEQEERDSNIAEMTAILSSTSSNNSEKMYAIGMSKIASMHSETMKTFRDIFGTGENQCDIGTTKYDAYIAEVKAKNKAVEVGLKEGTGLLKWLGTVWGIVEVADKFGDKISDGSSKTTTSTRTERTDVKEVHQTGTSDSNVTSDLGDKTAEPFIVEPHVAEPFVVKPEVIEVAK